APQANAAPASATPDPAQAQTQGAAPAPGQPAADPAAQPKAAAADPAAAQPAAAASDTPAPVATDPAAAKEEKSAGREALNKAARRGAIESGGRAVQYDPTAGGAGPLPGAASLEKGRAAGARKAFLSCTKEAKKGPIGECRAMLR